MKVILLERIAKLGGIGDEVTVKNGFARNFLLPSGRALRATDANRERFAAERAQIEARNAERKSEAEKIAEGLEGTDFIVVRSAGETGQLYGSVSTRDVADILGEAGFSVGRNQVDLKNPIKTIGLHKVDIVLHAEVINQVTLNVARSADEAERQAAGEDLSSAEAIYGTDEDAFESLANFDDDGAPIDADVFEEGATPEAGEADQSEQTPA